MTLLSLIDAAPDPVGIGVVLAVVIFVIAFVLLLIGLLVFFLWYRKRRMRTMEMIRPNTSLDAAAAQPNNPNQP